MNQRDQNRYGQRPDQGPRGQRQGRYGAMPEADAGQQRPSRSRFFTDTYNPEPQWLREEHGAYRDEDRGYGQRQDRPFGTRQQAGGAMRYGRGDQGQDYGRERGQGQRMGAGWDEDYPGPGQYQGGYGDYGSSRFEAGRGGYGPSPYGDPGYAASRSASGGYSRVPGYGMERGQPSYRGFGPQGYKRSDDRIRDDVCERLTDDAGIDASNVTIDVNQGAVTLSGSVPERYMRYAAEDLVDDAMGVESINNQLRVQSRGEGTMAPGSRAAAPSEMEKQKH